MADKCKHPDDKIEITNADSSGVEGRCTACGAILHGTAPGLDG